MDNGPPYTAIIAFLGVLSTTILGFLGWNRSKRADDNVAKAGALEQIINGLNALIDNLQEDNKLLRESSRELRDALEKAIKERDEAKEELKNLLTKYGTSGK